MNIEIANRLVELRKKNGLSQEQLAEKLGLSRQAVSKWERAEASPDTDNLICLAKLYGVSLDDLLNTDQSIEDIARETAEAEKQEQEKSRAEDSSQQDGPASQGGPSSEKKVDGDSVHIGFNGIHVHSKNGDEVHIGPDGFYVNDENETVVDGKDVFVLRPNEEERKRRKKISKIESIVTGSLFVIATVLYVVFGVFFDDVWPYPLVWPIGWVMYLFIPMIGSIFQFLKYKKASNFTVVFVMGSVIAFMILGLGFGQWHPGWVVFFSIPLWGLIAKPIDEATKEYRHRNYIRVLKPKKVKDNDDDDDDDEDDD